MARSGMGYFCQNSISGVGFLRELVREEIDFRLWTPDMVKRLNRVL